MKTKGRTMIATTTEPKCIAERRAMLEKRLANLDAMIAPAIAAQEVFGDEVRIEFCSVSDSIRVQLHLDDYAEVVPYLRELAQRGYRAEKGSEFYEDDEKTCRCYTRGGIKVWASLTGRKCKRVQVGTKVVPVYAIECEGATA